MVRSPRPHNVARLMEKYGDAKLPDLRHVLADCPKAKSFSIHDQCKVRYGEDSRFGSLSPPPDDHAQPRRR